MVMLASPIEIWGEELPDTIVFKVLTWKLGQADIHPEYGERIKRIEVLRLNIDRPLAEGRMPWLDITSNRLREVLLPHLKKPDLRRKVFTVRRYGTAPKRVFSVEVTTPVV